MTIASNLLLDRLWAPSLNERSTMRIALALVFAMCVASAAVAQQAQPNALSAPNSQSTVPLPGIDDAAMVSSARANKINRCRNQQGEYVNRQIDDVLVDLDRGSVSAVVLSVGGFLGMGGKLIAVPSNQIKGQPRGKIHHRSDKGSAYQCTGIRSGEDEPVRRTFITP